MNQTCEAVGMIVYIEGMQHAWGKGRGAMLASACLSSCWMAVEKASLAAIDSPQAQSVHPAITRAFLGIHYY